MRVPAWLLVISFLLMPIAGRAQTSAEAAKSAHSYAWIDKHQHFIVAVERRDRLGSGLLFGRANLVLTARWLVDTPGPLRVTVGGKIHDADVIAVDANLAVLQLHATDALAGFPLGASVPLSDVQVGQGLVALGVPRGWRMISGIWKSKRLPAMPAFVRATRIESDTLYAEGRFTGAEGGVPLFTDDGALVGVSTGDPALPSMLARVADPRVVLERAKHPAEQPSFKPRPDRAIFGGLGVVVDLAEGGLGIDDRFGFRRNHLLLSARLNVTWEAIEPTRTSEFVEKSRFFVMPAIGGAWKLGGDRLSASLGGAIGAVMRERVIVTGAGKRTETNSQARVRPMLDITVHERALFFSAAAELWSEPSLFLSIGFGGETKVGAR